MLWNAGEVQRSPPGGDMDSLRSALPTLTRWGLVVALVVLFGALVYFGVRTAESPPRLADPAPTAPPGPVGPKGSLPPQARGAYDPNTRVLALLAFVSPLLTTIIGFYFGKSTGEATGEAVKSEVRAQQAQIPSALYAAGHGSAVDVLLDKGLITPFPGGPADGGSSGK